MEKRQLKPALLAGLLTALVAACSAGNSTPSAPSFRHNHAVTIVKGKSVQLILPKLVARRALLYR